MSSAQSFANRHRFRPDIEGMRAVAVLLVLLYHGQVPWFGGGFLGVDVFFALSGFLITRALLTEVEETGMVDLKEFYARRIRRLLPASVLVLGTSALGVWLLLPVTMWRDFGGDIASAAAYVVNWRLAARSVDYLAEDVVSSPVQHFWSLAVEEQFYVLWPALIILGLMIHRRSRWSVRKATGAVLLLGVLTPSLTWSVLSTATTPASAFFVTTTRLWELALGAAVAIVPVSSLRVSRRVLFGAKALALTVIIGMSMTIHASTPWPGAYALGPTLATAVLILAGTPERSAGHDIVSRGLSLAPMQKVGAWSYSLYLWHWPPIAILSARWGGLTTTQSLAIVGGSVIPAWLSYRLVENPLRFLPRLRESARLSLSFGLNLSFIGVVAGLVVVLAIPVDTLIRNGAGSGDGEEVSDSQLPVGAQFIVASMTDDDLLASLDSVTSIVPTPALAVDDVSRPAAEGCHSSFDEVEPRVCQYGQRDAATHIVAIGDSKALQWAPALIEIAERIGWKFSTITKSACEISLTTSFRDGVPYVECREWTERVLQYLQDEPPDIVLVSQAFGGNGNQSERDVLVTGMLDAYQALEAMGTRLVVIIDNPHPGMPVYECVARHINNLSMCTFDRQSRIESGGRGAQLDVINHAGYDSVDLLDMVCPTQTCLPVIGGVLVYRQGSHLTATYVQTLGYELESRLQAFLPES